MKSTISRVILAVMALSLSACAHQWTPQQLAALKAKHADPCNYQTSGGGKCRNLWTANDGTDMPIDLAKVVNPAR